jgi:hypothetical protein
MVAKFEPTALVVGLQKIKVTEFFDIAFLGFILCV